MYFKSYVNTLGNFLYYTTFFSHGTGFHGAEQVTKFKRGFQEVLPQAYAGLAIWLKPHPNKYTQTSGELISSKIGKFQTVLALVPFYGGKQNLERS